MEFRDFISKTLSHFILDQAKVNAYTNDLTMEMWLSAFTNGSVDPINNYSMFKIRGDAILRSIFTNYLMDNYKNITRNQITEVANKYSGNDLIHFSKLLEFNRWIRTKNPSISDSILRENFKAFMGCLFEVSRLMDPKSDGYDVCGDFIVWLFKNVEIDIETTTKKTYVQQIFHRYRLEPVSEKFIDKVDGIQYYQLRVTKKTVDFFLKKGITIERVIGEGSGETKKSALTIAYDKAYANLISIGLTKDWLKKEKESRSEDKFKYE